jgi:Ca2+-binding EF-hand superfamily protein
MLKSSGSGDIFNRLYNKKGVVPSDDQTNHIMENVYFLNRNCKFLSFAEKENLIQLLKKRDPEVEEILNDFKDNKVSKEKMKESLYVVLYPKRFTKKHNENLNPAASVNELKSSRTRKSPNAREQRKDQGNEALSASIKHNRLSENPFTDSQRKMEHSSSSGFQKPALTVAQLTGEKTFGTERRAGNLSISQQQQQPPVKKKTRQHSEYEIISHRYQTHQKRMSEMDLYIEKLHQQKNEYLKSGDLTQQVEAKSAKPSLKHHQSQMLSADESPYQIKRHMSSVDQAVVDQAKKMANRRPERGARQENSRGRIPSCSPVRYNHEDSKVDIMSCSVIHPDLNRSYKEAEISYRSQPKTSEMLLTPGLNRSDLDADNKWLNKHRNSSEVDCLFMNEFDLNASREEGPNARLTAEFNVKNDPNSIVTAQRKVQESIDSKLQNPLDMEDFVNIGSRPKLLTSFGSRDFKESKQGTFFKEASLGKGPTSLVQISVETLGKKQDTEEYDEGASIELMTRSQINMKKETFGVAKMASQMMSQSFIGVSETTASKYMTNPAMSFDPGLKFFKENVKSDYQRDKIPSFISVDGNLGNLTRPISPMNGDLNRSLLDTSINGINRSERFISVNLLKKIFDDVAIFAEDIVDEVFRYIGEHIVNKNYFVQIMTSFLKDVPAKHAVKPKEIATKIFEICDRNGDGMISANDLGSRVTLFSQHKDSNSKEKKVYDMLDPSGRGFIIETDLITSLTRAQALACSLGTNLFEDHQEILEEARRIFKELDREGKGVVTYWDVFLWKDTESFANLSQKLEKYSAKSDTLVLGKAASVALISPIGNKDIFFYGSAQKSYDNTYSLPSAVSDFKPFASVFQPPTEPFNLLQSFNKPLETPKPKIYKEESSVLYYKSPEKPKEPTPKTSPLKLKTPELPKTMSFKEEESEILNYISPEKPKEPILKATPKTSPFKVRTPDLAKVGITLRESSLVKHETPLKSPQDIVITSPFKVNSPGMAKMPQETPKTMSFEDKSPMTSGQKSERGVSLVQLRETADFTAFMREFKEKDDVDETPGFAGYIGGDFTSYTKDTSDFTASDKDGGEFGGSEGGSHKKEAGEAREGRKEANGNINAQEVKKRRYQVETFLQYKARQLGEDLAINNMSSAKAFQMGRYAMPMFSNKARKDGGKLRGDSETEGTISVEMMQGKKEEEGKGNRYQDDFEF